MRRYRFLVVLAALSGVVAPQFVRAQSRVLRVVSTDSVPVVYAFVTVDGANGRVADENGRVSLGAGKRATVTIDVRRIGFQPFSGKIELPDTAATVTVTLRRLAQALGEVRIADTASNGRVGLKLQGFYDRWLMRQKGTLSATFIGPEEIESRHPDRITNMLRGLNGVSFRQTRRANSSRSATTASAKWRSLSTVCGNARRRSASAISAARTSCRFRGEVRRLAYGSPRRLDPSRTFSARTMPC